MTIDINSDVQTVELPTLLTEEQAHELVAHIWTMNQWQGLRNRKQGPRYSRLAGKLFYKRSDVIEWFNSVVETNAVDMTAKPRKRKTAAKEVAKPAPKSNGKAKAKAPADELA